MSWLIIPFCNGHGFFSARSGTLAMAAPTAAICLTGQHVTAKPVADYSAKYGWLPPGKTGSDAEFPEKHRRDPGMARTAPLHLVFTQD
jgi:hypothetical protein